MSHRSFTFAAWRAAQTDAGATADEEAERAARHGTARLGSQCPADWTVAPPALSLSLSRIQPTHTPRTGGTLWRRWDRSQLAPFIRSSVLLRRPRRTSAAPTCLPTGAWSGRWRRRRPAASSTSAPENWRSFPGQLRTTTWRTRWRQVGVPPTSLPGLI